VSVIVATGFEACLLWRGRVYKGRGRYAGMLAAEAAVQAWCNVWAAVHGGPVSIVYIKPQK